MAYVDLDTTVIQAEAAHSISQELAQEHNIIPLYELGGGITIAASTPKNRELINRLQELTNRRVSLVFSFPDEISDTIEITYQSREALEKLIAQTGLDHLDKRDAVVTAAHLKALAGQEFVVNYVRGLVLLAFRERASDIHIEPHEGIVHIRFRIDGVLQKRFTLEDSLLVPIISRLKILAGVDITERRRPQDGRLKMELSHRALDLRFSSIPTIYGEKVVLRLLGQIQFRAVPDLSDLRLSASIMGDVQRVINTPNGVFFVTGPTGSGKTTTLYAILRHLNGPEVNIMTIEDPVEYRLDGINQVQVNHEIDFDFASALRSFLRQDPDVILVGEIRDPASAKIAAQAALTGHLVLSTLHTNNALQAVTRLCEIGVEPFLVAPSIIGVMAQRLVRRICDQCKFEYLASPEVLTANFIWDGNTEVRLSKGAGCKFCGFTGYHGRIAVHELFVITDEVRSLVAGNASILEIEQSARCSGFKPLRYDGLKKALRGLTTLEEIESVSYPAAD